MDQLQKKRARKDAVSKILKRLNGFSFEEAMGILDAVQYKLREIAIVNYCPDSQEDIH